MYINMDRYLKEAQKMSFTQTSLTQIRLISSHNSVYKNKFDLVLNAVLGQIDLSSTCLVHFGHKLTLFH